MNNMGNLDKFVGFVLEQKRNEKINQQKPKPKRDWEWYMNPDNHQVGHGCS